MEGSACTVFNGADDSSAGATYLKLKDLPGVGDVCFDSGENFRLADELLEAVCRDARHMLGAVLRGRAVGIDGGRDDGGRVGEMALRLRRAEG